MGPHSMAKVGFKHINQHRTMDQCLRELDLKVIEGNAAFEASFNGATLAWLRPGHMDLSDDDNSDSGNSDFEWGCGFSPQ